MSKLLLPYLLAGLTLAAPAVADAWCHDARARADE